MTIGKERPALRCLKAPASWSQSDKANAILWVSFTNPCINLLAPHSVTRDISTTPTYLDFFTCCSVLLTRSIQCLGFPERLHTPVFLVLIFIPALAHAAKSWSSVNVEGPVEKMPAVPNRLQKLNGWTCSPNCDTLVDSAVTVCSMHVDYEKEWWQHTHCLVEKTFAVHVKGSGDSTHPCRNPTPTVNRRDLTLPTRTQTSEQECSDLTPKCEKLWGLQSISRGTRSHAFSSRSTKHV